MIQQLFQERLRLKILEVLGRYGIKLEEKKLNKFVENISDIVYDLPDEALEIIIIDNFTIGESYFFRDTETFKRINEILKQKENWKILSVGCSRGEEVYSVSIISKNLGVKTNIVGIDVNYQRIEEAKCGCYRFWNLRFLSESEINRYFIKHDDKYYIKDEFKEGVNFYNCSINNCLEISKEKFDIIFIRRVLIYLDNVETVLEKACSLLSKDGYLILGAGEYFKELYNYFETAFDDTACILKRKDAGKATKSEGKSSVDQFSKTFKLYDVSKTLKNRVKEAKEVKENEELGKNLDKLAKLNKKSLLKLQESFEEEIKTIERMIENKMYKQAYDKLKAMTLRFPTEYLIWKYLGIIELELSLIEEANNSIKKAIFLNHYDDEVWQIKHFLDRFSR